MSASRPHPSGRMGVTLVGLELGTGLAVLVGGGFTFTALWQGHGGRFAEMLSLAAGIGIVAFEGAEMAWIGFQPLQALFAGVGVAVALLAVSGRRQRRRLHRVGAT
ncbi:MAG TPA: hypothetical protein VFW71_15755 [Actinomycetota bacterium]|nr:hypothetical protein [Actinomycetota bacterium]